MFRPPPCAGAFFVLPEITAPLPPVQDRFCGPVSTGEDAGNKVSNEFDENK
jgi:hypothetical protein